MLLVTTFAQTLSFATPLVFASLAGVVSERAGIVNIALEAMLLIGAYGYSVGGALSGNVWLAVLAAVVFSSLFALALAVLSLRFQVDQIVVGMALNLAAAGLSAFMYRAGVATHTGHAVPGINAVQLGGLSHLPIVGPILFSQSVLTYVAILAVLAVYLFFRFTRFGLWVRATGENPHAVDSAGIDVFRVRYGAVLAGGVLCGLGGAFILSQVHNFSENMTAGVGYIALAAVIFGKWEPLGALWASLFFALFQALQVSLQVSGVRVPYQFLLIMPYAMTIIAIAGFVGRAVGPASEGQVYRRE